MAAIQKKKKFSFKVLVKEGDYNFDAIYAEYRWVPKEYFSSIPFYVYGTKLAFLFFDEETTIHVIDHAKIAEAQLIQFNIFWDQAIIPPEKK